MIALAIVLTVATPTPHPKDVATNYKCETVAQMRGLMKDYELCRKDGRTYDDCYPTAVKHNCQFKGDQ